MRDRFLVAMLLSVLTVSIFADKISPQHYTAIAILPGNPNGPSTIPLSINIQGTTDDETMNDLGQILADGNNQKGLLSKFQHMPGIGQVSREGRVGVPVKVIRIKPTSDGGKEVTMLTDRWISLWELNNSPSTTAYPYGLLRFTVNAKGEGTGKAYPIVRIKGINPDDIAIDDYGIIPIQVTVHEIK